jgi:hypothetical protein
MSLPNQNPLIVTPPGPLEVLQMVGLAGSHRHFLRTWSACLTGARGHSEAAQVVAERMAIPEDAYSIAGRSLAVWSGQPWAADLFTERPAVPPHASRTFLLPPTSIGHPSDVTTSVELLLAQRRGRPDFWKNGRAALLYTLCTLVSEMGQNICEHSRSVGCVAVCWHEGGAESSPFVSVGIVDAGIGIRTSIVERLRVAGQPSDLSDAEAIARALELPYPVNSANRGTGLRMSRDLIQRHRGVMHIRSGGAVVSMGPSAQCLVGQCSEPHVPVPGAQICVYLRPRPAKGAAHASPRGTSLGLASTAIDDVPETSCP